MVNDFVENKRGSWDEYSCALWATAGRHHCGGASGGPGVRVRVRVCVGPFAGGAPGTEQAVRVAPPPPASSAFVWDEALVGAGVAVGLGTVGAIGVGRSGRRTDRGVVLG